MSKKFKVVWNGELISSDIPGKYAGSRNNKIFGRLDCSSGTRLLQPKNRVFFHDWEDAIEAGYRPCKVCHPEVPCVNERLSVFHPILEQLHVAIFETNPRPHPNKPGVCFYVALLSETNDMVSGVSTTTQVDLEDWYPYPVTIKKAVAWGRLLGLPVVDHFWRTDNRVRYVPEKVVTLDQLCAREGVYSFRAKKSLTSDMMGHIIEFITTKGDKSCHL